MLLYACAEAPPKEVQYPDQSPRKQLQEQRLDLDSATRLGPPHTDLESPQNAPTRPAGIDASTSSSGESLEARSRELAELAHAQAAAARNEHPPDLPEPLHAYSRSQVLSTLGVSDSGTLQLRALRAESPISQIWILVYRAPQLERPLATSQALLFLTSEGSGNLVREAAGALEFPADICVDTANSPETSTRELSLDAAQYVLAPGTMAIGVRLTCSISTPSSEGEETHVALLVRQGESLHQVLWLLMSRGSLDRVSRVETSEESVLSLLPSRHGGYYDVAVQTTVSRRAVPLDDSPDRVLSSTTIQRVFLFDGNRYLARK